MKNTVTTPDGKTFQIVSATEIGEKALATIRSAGSPWTHHLHLMGRKHWHAWAVIENGEVVRVSNATAYL